ncbi:pentapeptide repeat-containing protein [Streptomyces sp. SID13031]|uniref:pentapeptide repeat-containing protein n=1 Tax=Streptomyces sp. SID13031 TaxID=2706046 RepID=UPI0013CA4E13|nr:pentapeptide repeat-containing protein [Streptomyces sp. SID13031]NEA33744.1 pentapeptide repeat-containing protein [Streptomyces sp. SID13031]
MATAAGRFRRNASKRRDAQAEAGEDLADTAGPQTRLRTVVQWVGWTRVASITVTVAAIGALWYTGQSLRSTERQFDVQYRLTEQGQFTERFGRAIDQLGSASLDVRLGGIHSLERLARDSAQDRTSIMQVLATFVRIHGAKTPKCELIGGINKASDPKSVQPDIEEAVAVIGRRLPTPDLPRLKLDGLCLARANLASADLRLANLENTDLSYANLTGANLLGAKLSGANLKGAVMPGLDLRGVSMVHADLSFTHLRNANLSGADLSYSNLKWVRMEGANLSGANLHGTDGRGALFERANLTAAVLGGGVMKRAAFSKANLSKAVLAGSDFEFASFDSANLRDADLAGASLTSAFLESADLTNARTKHDDPNRPWTNMSKARLKKANLSGVDLSGVNLTGADLSEAIGYVRAK